MEGEVAGMGASVRERVRARGVSSRMVSVSGRVWGVIVCQWVAEEVADMTQAFDVSDARQHSDSTWSRCRTRLGHDTVMLFFAGKERND